MPDMQNLPPDVSKLFDKIQKARRRVEAKKEERSEVNEAIAEARAGMDSEGLDKVAFDFVLKFLTWDEPRRKRFIRAFGLISAALDAEVSTDDLFSYTHAAPERPQSETQKHAAKKGINPKAAAKAESKKPGGFTRSLKEAAAADKAEIDRVAAKKANEAAEQKEGASILDPMPGSGKAN
jgi:hypothetical protein